MVVKGEVGRMYKTCTFMIVLVFVGPVLAEVATRECPSENYFNGTSCTPCSKCEPGYGVKTHCKEKEDTECQQCWLGYDYSNTTSMEECQLCINKDSKCLAGNYKVIINCTRLSPTVCSGCADGNYFDSSTGPQGGCIACSPPCGANEVETMNCTTEHDRLCSKQWRPTQEMPSLSTDAADPVSTETSNIPSTALDGTDPPVEEDVNENPSEDTKGGHKLWFLFFIVLAIPVIIVPVVLWKKRRRLKKNSRSSGLEQAHPLMPRGLDTLIRDLKIQDRTFISKHLNGKDSYGYYHWQKIAEKFGLRDEIRNWERADNPSEKLLTAFAEKEGSTIRKIIEACKEVGLTLFASDLEEEFSQTNQRGSDGYIAYGDTTWV